MYNAKLLTVEDYENFETLYENFCKVARTDYNFELEPIDFEGFLNSVAKNLIKCIILYDNHRPVGFLVYTTAISEGIELNIVYCAEKENYLNHSRELLTKFLELTKHIRRRKIVCYPMLGEQKSLIGVVAQLGFKFIGIEVLRFQFQGSESIELFKRARMVELPQDYRLESWNHRYFDDAVKIVQEAFIESSDALFDPRFKTLEGCRDIINKIVNDVYAEFMPASTSVLLYNDKPVGFSFINITDSSIVNIPIAAISKDHQGKGLSTLMLKKSMDEILKYNDANPIQEINTTTETDNLQALRLYKNLGFIEDYSYPQSYLPISD